MRNDTTHRSWAPWFENDVRREKANPMGFRPPVITQIGPGFKVVTWKK